MWSNPKQKSHDLVKNTGMRKGVSEEVVDRDDALGSKIMQYKYNENHHLYRYGWTE